MKRGEIRWYKLGRPDQKRPVLILSRASIIEYLGEVTVAPITGTIRDIPSEVLLAPEDGLPKAGAVNCDHLQTVTKSRIGPLVATLSPTQMREVGRAIRFALDL